MFSCFFIMRKEHKKKSAIKKKIQDGWEPVLVPLIFYFTAVPFVRRKKFN